ncbi:MAG: hypothetical protein HN580_06955 [Deltaproteobacteria bacterium]|jgi:hypothetical protein|nr:hypothetical protein [Deltaproteobacteria bacterium]MBT4266226.1 hypothetical protein [Deltaproteobacteria bacterium]MBT4637383.1 hypothetical protein [Deltaproteobacteria bacterium]MBT6500932.1 hypothetical protein [Deltaproteobacteria bacterium]MBT6614477.1 hypothetical protein [Deltaproteobacteria bacterium]
MKRAFLTVLLVTLLSFSTCYAQSETKASDKKDQANPVDESTNVTYVSPKKVILVPGSIQKIKKGKASLMIEYKELHKTKKFPIIRIQGIPFKLRKKGDNLVFTWQQAGYEVVWVKGDKEVILMSSEPFKRKSFSVKNKDVKNSVIYKGLVVETKRRDGVISKLEVADVVKDASGNMEKFSVRTFANKDNPAEFHNENNILAPEFHKQYEKGINDEVLYIFTSNKKGEIFVYYR